LPELITAKVIRIRDVTFCIFTTSNGKPGDSPTTKYSRIWERNTAGSKITIARVHSQVFEWLKIVLLCQRTCSFVNSQIDHTFAQSVQVDAARSRLLLVDISLVAVSSGKEYAPRVI
jgi:hypothetical protein